MLRALAEEIGTPGVHVRPSPDCTLVFGIRGNYVPFFKTMCYSMLQAETMLDCPLAIVTDDPAVRDDPFCQRVADRIEMLDETVTGALSELQGMLKGRSNFKRDETRDEAEWAGGTFLKWAAFRDWGTKTALFLDADMVVLGDLSGLCAQAADDGCLFAPQFPARIYRKADETRQAEPDIRANLWRMLEHGALATETRRFSINSGVMLIGRDLLSDGFLPEAVAVARDLGQTFRHEQAMLNAVLDAHPRWRKVPIGGRWNFHEEFLNSMPIGEQIDLLAQIVVLHYAGPIKPWGRPIGPDRRLGQMIWWRIEHLRRKAMGD